MNSRIEIGELIAKKRREKGLTQEALIELIGDDRLSIATLRRIEGGSTALNLRKLILQSIK